MESLKQAMRWDEEVFGLEYDLDLFNIVAVDDFNMVSGCAQSRIRHSIVFACVSIRISSPGLGSRETIGMQRMQSLAYLRV